MPTSAFDLFTIGIGPSSSHTIGPMRAANRFVDALSSAGLLSSTATLRIQLFGSLGATGKGHGTSKALIGGLHGWQPESADPDELFQLERAVTESKKLSLLAQHEISLDPTSDIEFSTKSLTFHSNGMKFAALDSAAVELLARTYYSVGGGFVAEGDASPSACTGAVETDLPFPFASGNELLRLCDESGLSISSLMLENEKTWRQEKEVREKLLQIWEAMKDCTAIGCRQDGVLPGGLKVKRRAAPMYRKLSCAPESSDPSASLDWVNLWALAVNEQNAAGGRVVTAPTNGAAGIIPAVLHYFHKYRSAELDPSAKEDATVRFLLTAAAIGVLFKTNASISGAEVGCQGEVGTACSMAAAGLCEILGGSPQQVENAAEIGMEHNLGLTCDPIGGLVQVPCIERNAMGAVKAINSSQLALQGDGRHFVSLDKVIKTMRDTGRDMKSKYKETSRGGLAVNVIEC